MSAISPQQKLEPKVKHTAKSRLGRLKSHPLAFQVQHAIGQYTIVAQQKAKIMDGMMRPRSKDPPMTSCTVQAQKSIW
jgi:hypothetical protein